MNEIRSVSVHLDADVAAYIAKMKAAGEATDRAFSSSSHSIDDVNSKLADSSDQLDKVDTSAKKATQSTRSLGQEVDSTSRKLDNGAKSADKFQSGMALLVQSAIAFGPALVPIGAVAIPAVAGLASELGFAAAGAGTLVFAFHGVGKALTAFNKAELNPTVANINAAQAAMDALPPSAQAFVLELHKLGPEVTRLGQAAGTGLFPGLTSGLHAVQADGPLAERILHGIGLELGTMGDQAGHALASNQWRPFLRFVGQEAPATLHVLGQSAGSVAHGLTGLWMAFTPLNHGVDAGILRMAQDFDRWANSLGKTKGFESFVEYVQTNGPKVTAFLGDTAHLLEEIVVAAAPLGGPTLQALDLVAKVLGTIASSPLGTPLIMLVQLNAVMKLTNSALGRMGVESRIGFGGISSGAKSSSASLSGLKAEAVAARDALRTIGSNFVSPFTEDAMMGRAPSSPLLSGVNREGLAALGKGITLAGGLAFIASGAADKVGMTNTATLGLAGSMAGPLGAAVGVVGGALLDYQHAASQTSQAQQELDRVMQSSTSTFADYAAAFAKSWDDYQATSGKFEAARGNFGAALSATLSDPLGAVHYAVAGLTGHDPATQHAQSDFAAVEQQSAAEGAITQIGSNLGDPSLAPDHLGNLLVPDSSTAKGLAQLTQLATRAQPAMDALGITLKQLGTEPAAIQQRDIDAITQWIKSADSATGRTHAVAAAFAAMSNQTLSFDDRVKALSTALDALLGPGLNLSAAADSLHQGLNDLAKSLDRTNHSIRGFSDAAIQNRGVIRTQVSAISTWIQAEAAHHVPAAKMTADLKAQRQALIDAGAAAGISRGDMQHYLDTLGLTPKMVSTAIQAQTGDASAKTKGLQAQLDHLGNTHAKPSVTANPNPALAAIRAVEAGLAGLHNRTVYISTVHTGGNQPGGMAWGGTVHGPRLPYRDRVLTMLAPGEEVISNRRGQADLHRPLLKAINAGMYADGGTATRQTPRRLSPVGATGVSAASYAGVTHTHTRVIEHHHHMPRTVTLQTQGGRFEAYVEDFTRDIARDEMSAQAQYEERHGV